MTELAGIYCRMSVARFGDATKVDDQERICRNLAASRGWTVPDEYVFCDNNRSAWQRNRKRPDWDRMVALVKAGTLRNLVNYHGDRLIRQPWDLEQLLNFADSLGVVIVSPTGEYRLDVAHDRFILRILTAKACLESDDTSRRKKDQFKRWAREGRAPVPAGRYGRGYGYEADGRTPVPGEAAVIREAAARLVTGESLRGIAAELAARGVTTVSGQPISRDTLRMVLTRPRIAGLLTGGRPGNWEPILERATWEMVTGVLRTRALSHNPDPGPRARHLLSGIAECGLCESGLQRTTTHNGNIAYACFRPGCRKITRSMTPLDAYVTGRVVRRLNSPAFIAALAAPVADPAAAEITQLEARREETRGVIERLAEHPGADLALLTAALASFTDRIGQLRAAAQADPARRLLAAHQGITREQFRALPLHVRRSLVAGCFRVIVNPAGKHNGPRFDPRTVRLLPR